MKRFAIVLLFPILLFSANLIQNPGFETWTNGDSIPDNWSLENTYYVLSSKDSTSVFSGNYSVKLNRINAGNYGIKQFITSGVSPGDTFAFSLYILDNDSTKISGFLRSYKYGGGYSTDFLLYTSDNSSFQQITDTFVTPNGVCSLGVFIRSYKDINDSGIAYIDNTYLDIYATGSHQPPYIYDSKKSPQNVTSNDNVVPYVSVSTDDNATISEDTMFYKVNNNGTYSPVSHDSISGSTYYYSIPAQNTNDTVYYYYRFKDSSDSATISDTFDYIIQPQNVPDVFINEIMYNPSDNDTYYEYVELWNLEGDTVNMTNWTLSDGEATFTFPTFQLPPNNFAVVCRDTDSIRALYQTKSLGDGDDYLFGNMSLALSNSGDQVILKTGTSTLVDSVNYDDSNPWPTAPDGSGPSLELKDPLNYASHNQGGGWAASTDSGTPGDINSQYNPSGISYKIPVYQLHSTFYISNMHIYINSPYNGKKSIILYNISGARLFGETYFSRYKSMSFSNYHNGIYFIKVKSPYENTLKKFVIIK